MRFDRRRSGSAAKRARKRRALTTTHTPTGLAEASISTSVYPPVPPEKAILVAIAAAELGELSSMLLRNLATEFDPCAPTVLRFRGALLRFAHLAELIDECICQGDDVPVHRLERDLYGVYSAQGAEA